MPSALSNRLLSTLSPASRQSLEGKLEAVSLPVKTSLFEVGRAPKYAYFITSGLASVVTVMEDGGLVEVGLIGSEALPGAFRLLGAQGGSTRCFMQVGGTGLRVGFRQLLEQFHQDAELRARILQAVQYEALTLAQLAGCNRLHESDERLARWLLMAADRLQSDEVPLTQEFLSEMLASRRSTVSVSVGLLQRAGMIEYHRGHVRILNRESLESTACECYPIMCQLREQLYAVPIPFQAEP